MIKEIKNTDDSSVYETSCNCDICGKTIFIDIDNRVSGSRTYVSPEYYSLGCGIHNDDIVKTLDLCSLDCVSKAMNDYVKDHDEYENVVEFSVVKINID